MISDKILKISADVTKDIAGECAKIDEIAEANTRKVAGAYHRHKVSEACFAGTTGYGYNDKGREVMNLLFADIMKTGSALVSAGFVSGTHAIAAALFAALSPGQTLLSATGLPYDTLHGVIGISGNYKGSLKDYGINYAQIELIGGCEPDIRSITEYIRNNNAGAVFIQRSRGYSTRSALNVGQIGRICDAVHNVNKKINIIVDNCYGEFTETAEPGEAGADIIAGSLTKNPGGGLAEKGGYIAGREDLVSAAADRMAAPGIGMHTGATPGGHRLLYQGLYTAPHTTAQALKTAVFAARLFELLGYNVNPRFDEKRSDIIQSIRLGTPQLLEKFCAGIQKSSPVDSFVTPVASAMPGYDHDVIMAAGTFIQGSSIEMTADAPMRDPYDVYVQGALTFESGKNAIMQAASYLILNYEL